MSPKIILAQAYTNNHTQRKMQKSLLHLSCDSIIIIKEAINIFSYYHLYLSVKSKIEHSGFQHQNPSTNLLQIWHAKAKNLPHDPNSQYLTVSDGERREQSTDLHCSSPAFGFFGWWIELYKAVIFSSETKCNMMYAMLSVGRADRPKVFTPRDEWQLCWEKWEMWLLCSCNTGTAVQKFMRMMYLLQ